MSNEDVARIVAETLRQYREERDNCPYTYDDCPCETEQHKREHEFVKAAIEVMGKLNDVKWSTLKTILAVIVAGILGLVMLGLSAKMRLP
jgi:hypothetical protein